MEHPALWDSVDVGRVRFGVSHPCDKNKSVARMGHPSPVASECGAILHRRLHVEEVADHLVAALGEDAFGMELDALNGEGAMAQAHNHGVPIAVFGGAGGDGQFAGERALGHDERVIAGAGERGGQIVEDALAVVIDGAGFAVHEMGGADDLAAEGLADGLVAETDAEDGHFSGHVANERDENAGLAGCTGAGREQNALGPQSFHLLDGQLVVAIDLDLCAQFAQVLDQVVGERVVVVEDEDHGGFSVARRVE